MSRSLICLYNNEPNLDLTKKRIEIDSSLKEIKALRIMFDGIRNLGTFWRMNIQLEDFVMIIIAQGCLSGFYFKQ